MMDNDNVFPGASDSNQPPPAICRVSVTMPAIQQVVMDGAACLVIVVPDIAKPGEQLSFHHMPSGPHMIAVVASALSQLRRAYGEVALRQAIKQEPHCAVDADLVGQVKTPSPSLFDGPIGGGRIP